MPDQITKPRAPRTSKACDFCKLKKLKCDGNNPCERCQKVHHECIYTVTTKPKVVNRAPPRKSRKTAVNALNDRIGKLESLLTTLVTKIEDNNGTKDLVQIDPSSSHTSIDTSSESSSSDTYPESATPESTVGRIDTLENPTTTTSTNDDTNHKSPGPCAGYVGSQCTLSIFSAPGLSWLSKKARDPSIIKPIINILHQIDAVVGAQRNSGSASISDQDVISLPTREECYQMLNMYEKILVFSIYIVSRDEMKILIDRYYDQQLLTSAEIMCLYLLAASGSCFKAEEAALNNHDIDVAKFQRLESDYLKSAFCYFARISVFGENIIGLKATLLLIFYSEFLLLPEVDYTLASVAVRAAQSLGLHRREFLVGLTKEEVLLRKRLWSVCYILDKDVCLKSGKPPIIHDDDISCFEDDILIKMVKEINLKTANRLGILTSKLDLDNNLDHCDEFYRTMMNYSLDETMTILEYTWVELAKIKSRAYVELFSANAFKDKTRASIWKIIGSLNEDLENLKKLLPITIRPGFPIKIPLDTKEFELQYVKIVKLQLSFHLISMVINRMALRKHWEEEQGKMEQTSIHHDHRIKEFGYEEKFPDVCIDSCFEIIRLCGSFIKTNFNLWLSLTFTVFSSHVTGLTFSMENPQDYRTKKIIKEMLNSILSVDHTVYPLSRTDLINFIKIIGMSFALSIFTKIALKIYNDHNINEPIVYDVDQLDQKIINLSQILTKSFESYNYQKTIANKDDNTNGLLSPSSIRDILYSHNTIPISNNSTTTPTGWNKKTIGIPSFQSHGRELLAGAPDYEKSLLGLTLNSMHGGNVLDVVGKEVNSYPLASHQHQPSNTHIADNQPKSTAEPPSIDEVLDSGDLNMTWNYFAQNLFNIPVQFMDENVIVGDTAESSQYLL